MNRELIVKAVALLVSYREYTGDCRTANVCGEIVEALKAELAKPDVTLIDKGNILDHGFDRTGSHMAGDYVDTAEQEPVGIVQRTSIAGFPMADSTGVEWLTTVSSGTKLYALPTVSSDNSAKAVEEFKPDWDAIKPLVERIVELELEIRDFERDVSTNFQNLNTSEERVEKSDKSMREMQRLGQELEQQPVAYWNGVDMFTRADEVEHTPNWSDYYPEPLYAAPPRKEWVGLTDDDRIELFNSMDGGLDGFLKNWGWLNFAKALEAKLKEKNI